jgi:glycerophosphoryl diester phosphodiesterase
LCGIQKTVECANTIDVYKKSNFAIGHRGAALMFPEHTASSYKAASVMGAGIIECDVTFTKDLELVCRHSQCDLHTTTNIVTVPEMNAKCTTPFSPGMEESPKCCTSDFTLEELKTLCAKMDASGGTDSAEEYAFGGTPSWRTDLYSTTGTSVCDEILTHSESIELIRISGDSYFAPELKSPGVEMPFTTPDGTVYTVDEYRQQIVDDYVKAKVPTEHVWLQSFVQ